MPTRLRSQTRHVPSPDLVPVGEVVADEHPRPATTLAALAKLPPIVRPDGTITAGNAAGINDGAAALLVGSLAAAERVGIVPLAPTLGYASAGVAPRLMGLGPIQAVAKLLDRLALRLGSLDHIKLNETFAAQVLACLRHWRLPDESARVNPAGGAIALGHPLGMSGARLAAAAAAGWARGWPCAGELRVSATCQCRPGGVAPNSTGHRAQLEEPAMVIRWS